MSMDQSRTNPIKTGWNDQDKSGPHLGLFLQRPELHARARLPLLLHRRQRRAWAKLLCRGLVHAWRRATGLALGRAQGGFAQLHQLLAAPMRALCIGGAAAPARVALSAALQDAPTPERALRLGGAAALARVALSVPVQDAPTPERALRSTLGAAAPARVALSAALQDAPAPERALRAILGDEAALARVALAAALQDAPAPEAARRLGGAAAPARATLSAAEVPLRASWNIALPVLLGQRD